MPCEHKVINGSHTIVCSRGQRQHTCESCGAPANIQCDYPVKRNGKNATCDRWQCRNCATNVGSNIDYCKPHANMRPAL